MSWAAWSLALSIGAVYYGSKSGVKMPSLPSTMDGSYLYEAPQESGGSWIRVAIRGDEATLTGSYGLSGTCGVERRGTTLRLIGGQLYQDGRPVPDQSKSRVDLMRIVDDGQALYWEGADVKLVRQ